MKYCVCVLRRPFECDYKGKEAFNSSLGLKNHTVCGFVSSPHRLLMTLEFCSFFIKMYKLCCLINCTSTQLAAATGLHSPQAEIRPSCENANWIDVAICCCQELLKDYDLYFFLSFFFFLCMLSSSHGGREARPQGADSEKSLRAG